MMMMMMDVLLKVHLQTLNIQPCFSVWPFMLPYLMAYLLFSVNVLHKVLNTLKIIFKLNSKIHAVFFPTVANCSIKTQHTVTLEH